jgi:hypothetical protein
MHNFTIFVNSVADAFPDFFPSRIGTKERGEIFVFLPFFCHKSQ